MNPHPPFFRNLKAWRILRHAYHRFKRKGTQLSVSEQQQMSEQIKQLWRALSNKRSCRKERRALQRTLSSLLPKSWGEHLLELVGAIAFALVAATLIRTVWFELYEIPSGSMRPTFQEKDSLVASKTPFSLNIPLENEHLYFDPDLLVRNQIVIFSVGDLPVDDPETTYFWLFRGKRLLVKRLIGKPGDRLYFYGGKVLGRDEQNHPFTLHFDKVDHLPMITFEGQLKVEDNHFKLFQTQEPLAKTAIKQAPGLLWVNQQWVQDTPALAKEPHEKVVTYSDFWGIGNYAFARLFTENVLQSANLLHKEEVGRYDFYLQLKHHPSLTFPTPLRFKGIRRKAELILVPQSTLIGLDQEHLNRLMNHLYTGRFQVKGGGAYRYLDNHLPAESAPLPGVPDGVYEFQDGKAYSISWGGVRTQLPTTHTLYTRSPLFCQTLFNLGFDFNPALAPEPMQPWTYTQRAVYFRDGDLYVMGAPLFHKGEPELEQFLAQELEHQRSSRENAPYLAFVDQPPPIAEDGGIDDHFLRTFGLLVPEKQYYVLGDNYAMSADSRAFGFVPQDYLKGSPLWLFWPVGPRWGAINQPSTPWFTLPHFVILLLVGGCVGVWAIVHRQRCETLTREMRKFLA